MTGKDYGKIKNIEPDFKLKVNNIIPLIDIDGSKVGYTASYFSLDDVPFGYIVLNFSIEVWL